MSILVIDVGTSSVRVAVVDGTTIIDERRVAALPESPAPGLVEFDAMVMATTTLDLARSMLANHGPIASIGITNQRASTIVWDRATGEPVANGLGWQDLRTLGDCLVLQADGLRFAPNQSATKLTHLLSLHDPDRSRDLCFGTVDSWIAFVLTRGEAHITDATNAGLTGLLTGDGLGWDEALLDRLGIPGSMLPTIVDSTGDLAPATALDGAPMIRGIAGDQQASLIGLGCVAPGPAKITFGTGGMLDMVVGSRPGFAGRGEAGTFPIITSRHGAELTWGVEAIMLSAGTNVEWLRDDLGLIDDAAESHAIAAACDTTDGVVYVPALLGLGTPHWDYGARGTLLGITRGTGRAQIVRAVLEGVAHRGVDLIEAAIADTGATIDTVRIDGGMSANPTFVQALADASQRPIEVSPVTEATALGAAFLAGLADGTWSSWSDIGAAWAPSRVVEPRAPLDRGQWARAIERASAWYPELSGLDF